MDVAQVGPGIGGDEDGAQFLSGAEVEEVAGEVAVDVGLGVEVEVAVADGLRQDAG